MGILNEFREFAVKGNVIDLAVGIVIGTAFGAITSSLVADVIMPPLGAVMGDLDFSEYALTLRQASEGSAAVELKYGAFIQTLVNFLIVAWAMFLLIKVVNRLKRQQDEAPPAPAAPPRQEVLLEEIRDLLKK